MEQRDIETCDLRFHDTIAECNGPLARVHVLVVVNILDMVELVAQRPIQLKLIRIHTTAYLRCMEQLDIFSFYRFFFDTIAECNGP